ICKKEKVSIAVVNAAMPDYYGMELPQEILSHSDLYGLPKFVLLCDSFLGLAEIAAKQKDYRISRIIKIPYKPKDVLSAVEEIVSPTITSTAESMIQELPAEYIQFFVDSTLELMKTLPDVSVKVGHLFFKKDPFSQADVSAKMDIKGNLEGTICISFEKRMALHLISCMLGEKFEVVTVQVEDGVGEVANIVTGTAKKYFADYGYEYKIGTPKVFSGKRFTHHLAPRLPCAVVPFLSDQGGFFIEICVKIHERIPPSPEEGK
ncbi:MAG: chemotaxis protein CheX, partial [Candidatus Aureabacteria bacterium]|nr:chemotaxis protein CheX [Candidatus Auribacterota bacterium]